MNESRTTQNHYYYILSIGTNNRLLSLGLILSYFLKYDTIRIQLINTINTNPNMMIKITCGIGDITTNGLDKYIESYSIIRR